MQLVEHGADADGVIDGVIAVLDGGVHGDVRSHTSLA
jgi:hypothetical protein